MTLKLQKNECVNVLELTLLRVDFKAHLYVSHCPGNSSSLIYEVTSVLICSDTWAVQHLPLTFRQLKHHITLGEVTADDRLVESQLAVPLL